jgi:hypothetical protein
MSRVGGAVWPCAIALIGLLAFHCVSLAVMHVVQQISIYARPIRVFPEHQVNRRNIFGIDFDDVDGNHFQQDIPDFLDDFDVSLDRIETLNETSGFKLVLENQNQTLIPPVELERLNNITLGFTANPDETAEPQLYRVYRVESELITKAYDDGYVYLPNSLEPYSKGVLVFCAAVCIMSWGAFALAYIISP